MLKLSLLVDSFSDCISDQLEIVKSFDLNHIELRNINGKSIVENSDNEIYDILNALNKENVSVSSLCTVIGKPTIDETFDVQIKKLLKSLKIAKILKSRNIRIFSDINSPQLKLKKLLKRFAEKYQINICIENEKNSVLEKLTHINKFFHCNNPKGMGLTLDIANLVEVGESPLEVIDSLSEKATYFHIRDLGIDYKETNMFEGICDIKYLISSTYSMNKFFTYEPKLKHISDMNRYDFFSNNVNKLINFMREENKNVILQ